MLREDMTVERPNYTYLCFINRVPAGECSRECESKIKHYVFGHTHRAGIAGCGEFKIYNTGSWARKARGKPEHCFSSFVLIDKEIKVMHMSREGAVECRFDGQGKCVEPCF